MENKILVNLTYFAGLQLQKQKKYSNFSGKSGVLFAQKITYFAIFPIFSTDRAKPLEQELGYTGPALAQVVWRDLYVKLKKHQI